MGITVQALASLSRMFSIQPHQLSKQLGGNQPWNQIYPSMMVPATTIKILLWRIPCKRNFPSPRNILGRAVFPPGTRSIWQVGSVKGSRIISCSHWVDLAQLDGSSAPYNVSCGCNLQGAQLGWNLQDGSLACLAL